MSATQAEAVGPSLITKVQAMAAQRRPDDTAFAEFVNGYLADLPDFDLDDRTVDELYAATAYHFKIGSKRQPGEIVIDVRTPTADRDGWDADRSFVFVVTDDMPFLVDTIRIVLERQRINTHLLIHPMVTVARTDNAVTAIDIDRNSERLDKHEQSYGMVEAWTQVEVDQLSPESARLLAEDLHSTLASVHRIVDDFAPMRERMAELAELDPLLEWLTDDHFVFLGAGRYRLDGAVAQLIEGTALGILAEDPTPDPALISGSQTVSFARSNAVSLVHRASRMTVVTVEVSDEAGQVTYQRFVGLLASAAYRVGVLSIPTIGDRTREVLGLAHRGAETHAGRSMRNVLETLPRDLVFELDAHHLAELVIDVLGLHERQIVRVFEVPEPTGTAATILVYLPKSRFTSRLPQDVAAYVGGEFGSDVADIDYHIGASNLARVTFTLLDWKPLEGIGAPDLDQLSDQIDEMTTLWSDRIATARQRRNGGLLASAAAVAKVIDAAPAEFQSGVPVPIAAIDLERIAQLADVETHESSTITALSREVDAPSDEWRIRVYRRGSPLSLSALLPVLGHLGLTTLEEHPYEFVIDGEHFFLLDIGVRVHGDITIDDDRQNELLYALDELLQGKVEDDNLNQLIVRAGLTTRQVDVLRAYAKYALQTEFPFSQVYVEDTLSRLPHIASMLTELFEAKFDPDRVDGEDRDRAVGEIRSRMFGALDAVRSLDDDRIARTFMKLIDATVRTSAFMVGKQTIAFKFDPRRTPDIPAPRPVHEIFVSSARVEGVHLRGGAIARGGIRWSDRFEDYRTEVLGLVKAQMVKNAVIVPVGAKGGFVAKQIAETATREERRAEGVACYRMYISSLLDITDNIVDGVVIHPERCVRYDGVDPYLVVAADKGTATFSDIANEIAQEYGFWLDDAFASGGSVGYDHKEMGITARGAWESVKRHFQHIGKNPETDVITVVGIGDMSGDVFGNGLLRSATIKLVAAFDHRHIFVDPDPDPDISFKERRRLYDLAGSTWDDYDKSLISVGGGVFARDLKAIEISAPMHDALGIDPEVLELTPNGLISAILRSPVDLLWNGGIGTYIKAKSETDASVGDRANDSLRINGDELRCKVVGEGGNLGVTQLGRIEYALNGGLIYTDAIDNSAGVDTSDHEVNIKILLRSVIEAGELTLKQRNELLESMTAEVAELVLGNNRAQTLALMIARQQGLPMVNVHARYLDVLETEGYLDRSLEFLPTDKQLAERQSNGSGLRTPEFAVMIAYTKNVNVSEMLMTDLPESPALREDLINYFPTPLRDKYREQILNHRLHREIAITQLVNQMTNLSGISYDHRMTEDTGSSVTDVARCWLVVREILDFPSWWAEIDSLQDQLELKDQLDLFLDCRRTAERCSLWFMRHRRPPVEIAAETDRFRPPMVEIQAGLHDALRGPMRRAIDTLISTRVEQNVPEEFARRAAVWRLLHTAFDIIEVAEANQADPVHAASVYWEMFDRMDLLWLWDGIGALPRATRWQTQARAALRDDLLIALGGLAGSVLEHDGGIVEEWLESNSKSFDRATAMLAEIRRADSFQITNLSVALRQLRNLAATAIR